MLGLSTSLQMTPFHSFLWLSDIPYADIENGLDGIGGQRGWEGSPRERGYMYTHN